MHSSDSVVLDSGAARLDLSLDGGIVESLRVRGVDILVTGPGRGSFPMVPWCGRLDRGVLTTATGVHRLPVNADPHSLHGTARDGRWRLTGDTATSATLVHTFTAPWPFAGTVAQTIDLDDDGVTMSMTVASDGDEFPAQAGWHPWFPRTLRPGGTPVQIAFDAAWQEMRGDDYLPTGRRIAPRPGPWDDCFGMPDGVDVTLTWSDTLRLRIQSPALWVVVYDLRDDELCVEPQSGPPNGLNTTPHIVTPAAPLNVTTRWSWDCP